MENDKLLILKVNGMTCKHCELTIENSLKEIDNIIDVEADREKKMVKIYYNHDLNYEQIKSIIEENGFKVLE